jgi:hypothetical protein
METVIIFLTDHPRALAVSLPQHTHMPVHTDVITPSLNEVSGEISDPSSCTCTPSPISDLQVDCLDRHKGRQNGTSYSVANNDVTSILHIV